MKKLLILLFSILISINSYGEWKGVAKNFDGDTFYIEIDTIKEHNGYVYYWELTDYLKPTDTGTMSTKMYKQGDCGVNREKHLSFIFYEQPMGRASGETYNPPDKWNYPTPDSVGGIVFKYVCDYVD
jgi:hypothetical protein